MLIKFSDRFKTLLTWTFLILMIVVFVFWGAVGLQLGDGKYVDVNGQRLSPNEISIFGKIYPNADLVQLTVGKQELNKIGFHLSNKQVEDAIRNISLFQIDGKFSEAAYQDYLKKNFSELQAIRKGAEFNNLIQQMIFALSQAQIVFPSTSEQYYKLMDQKRNVSILTVSQEKFLKDIEIKDSEIESYYNYNKAAYVEPEQIRLEYIKLNYPDVVKQIKVSDEDIEDYYNKNADQFIKQGRKKISLITINIQKDKAKETLDIVTNKLKDKDSFAELAIQFSDDKLTAKKGGDMGWFQDGDMGNPVLDEAISSIENINDTSAVVTANDKWHIFTVTDVQPKKQLPLKEVSLDIKTKVAEQRANTIYTEQKQQLELKSFEIADNLELVAKELNLPLLKTSWVNRQGDSDTLNNSVGKELIGNNKVIEIAFSEDVLENRNNSQLLDLNPESAVVFRVVDYKAQRTKELAEIKPDIKKAVQEIKAREKAGDYAKQLWQDFIKDNGVISLSKLEKISQNSKYVKFEHNQDVSYLDAFWNNNKNFKQEIISAFELPKPDQSYPLQAKLLGLQNGDQSILAIDKVTLGDYQAASIEQKEQTKDQLKYFMIMRDNANFYNRIAGNAVITNRL